MSCANPLERVSSLLDGGMDAGEQRTQWRIWNPAACATHGIRLRTPRQSLLEMKGTPMPDALAGRLQVLASHERERRLMRASFSAFFPALGERVWLSFDNMMRPRALPFAGGVISAFSGGGHVVSRDARQAERRRRAVIA